MKVSIIICTRNRCEDLRMTLEAFRRVRIPTGFDCELLVVDNASEDSTTTVVQSFRTPNLRIRHVYEPRRGQANARNRGLAEAEGGIILFTDDDVRPPEDWVEGMCKPILDGKADAVAGGIVIARELERPWMTPMHRAWLAASVRLDPQNPSQMVGANMAFAKSVLARVPAFDPELGPGGIGYGDDVLFSFQLKEAGFRLRSAFEVAVIHHFQPKRLERSQWLSAARGHADTQAYLRHHWQQDEMGLVRLRYWKALGLLALYRVSQPNPPPAEGCSRLELNLCVATLTHRQLLKERRRPRNYGTRGLIKRKDRVVVVPAEASVDLAAGTGVIP